MRKLLLALAAVATIAIQGSAAETNVQPVGGVANTNECIFFKSYELHAYLLRVADLPPLEKEMIRRKAYQFFFEYWLAHRSSYASLNPIPHFEKQFKLLLSNKVISSLSADEQADPQGIRQIFKDGKLTVPLGFVMAPWAVSREEVADWSRYQRIVKDYREFISKKD